MPSVLVVAEAWNDTLPPETLAAIRAGSSLLGEDKDRLVAAVIGDDPARHVPTLSLAGVDELVLVGIGERFEGERVAKAIAAVAREVRPDVVVMAHTIDAMGCAPAAAIMLDAGFASDVTELHWNGELRAVRGAFGGKLFAELGFPNKDSVIVLMRQGALSADPIEASEPSIRELELELDASRIEHVRFDEPEAADVDIAEAAFLLAIGRGIGEAENLPRFEGLAERLGATLAGSRPLIDAGLLPYGRQVGQSGTAVAPQVYLALGISGAVQHVAGLAKAGTIIAVNTDQDAPIFAVADFGVVADLYEIADQLEAQFE